MILNIFVVMSVEGITAGSNFDYYRSLASRRSICDRVVGERNG